MKKLFILALMDVFLVISGYVTWAFIFKSQHDGIPSIMIIILTFSIFSDPPGKMTEYPKAMISNFNTIINRKSIY